MGFQVQVKGEWAGSWFGNWAPAVCGTLNQSSLSDTEASTSETREQAEAALDFLTSEHVATDPVDGDPRDSAPQFRIVEV